MATVMDFPDTWHNIGIKNTFFELSTGEDTGAWRRCSSEPALQRSSRQLAAGAGGDLDARSDTSTALQTCASDAEDAEGAAHGAWRRQQTAPARTHSSDTDAEDIAANSWCQQHTAPVRTCVSDSEDAEDATPCTWYTSDDEGAEDAMPSTWCQQHAAPVQAYGPDIEGIEDIMPSEWCQQQVAPLGQHAGQGALTVLEFERGLAAGIPRTPLSSKAKLWQCEPHLHASMATPVEAQISCVISMVCSAMARGMPDPDVSSVEDANGWSVTAQCPEQDTGGVAACLARAREALLQGAHLSAGLCVLGSGTQPPVAGTYGFRVHLGIVGSKEAACWDFCTKGFCGRGARCKWQHPAYTVCVSVGVELT